MQAASTADDQLLSQSADSSPPESPKQHSNVCVDEERGEDTMDGLSKGIDGDNSQHSKATGDAELKEKPSPAIRRKPGITEAGGGQNPT